MELFAGRHPLEGRGVNVNFKRWILAEAGAKFRPAASCLTGPEAPSAHSGYKLLNSTSLAGHVLRQWRAGLPDVGGHVTRPGGWKGGRLCGTRRDCC